MEIVAKKSHILNILSRFYRAFMRYLHMQLFINLASLPLLIAWGIPFSYMSPISNLIFNPLLFALLFVCSGIFFSELIFVPNSLLIALYEKLVSLLRLSFSLGSPSWLIELPRVHPLILLCLPVAAFGILLSKKLATHEQKIAAYLIAFIAISLLLKNTTPPQSRIDTLSCNEKPFYCIRAGGQTMVIDPGCIGRRASSSAWLEFTLIPFLISSYGTSTIDHFVCLRPTKLTFDGLTTISQLVKIQRLYLPYWKGEVPHGLWPRFAQLQKNLQTHNTQFVRLGTAKMRFSLAADAFISLSKLPQIEKYHEMTFGTYQIMCSIGAQQLTIDSKNKKEIDKQSVTS